ncbi:MAG: hypothetical protein NC211_03650 [Alistipes senegalensis]|nr:hypothetical protein [Oxalobacter formigenes]MCM1280913.1 hypothetical protein [Alistipes senegalensis]
MSGWLGKVRGHVNESKSRFAKDSREREAAGQSPRSIILTEREVRGEWDASRVLLTTLGGSPRPITASDLAAFRQNMRQAEKRFGVSKSKKQVISGITARQVIDFASSKPLNYVPLNTRYESDIDKARREITMAVPVSALNGEIRFITNAGKDSKASRHHVLVKLNAFNEAAAQMAAVSKNDTKTPRQIANWLRKQKLAFDCDCERHRYFFRYVASIGGFAAGRPETGYPKIRNPNLKGVACKHVLRVMAELESSGTVLRFLEKHLSSVSEYKANTKIKQKEAEKLLKEKKSITRIKTSEQRKAEADRARQKAELVKAAQKASARKPKKAAPLSRRAKSAASYLAALHGLTPEQVLALLDKAKKKG